MLYNHAVWKEIESKRHACVASPMTRRTRRGADLRRPACAARSLSAAALFDTSPGHLAHSFPASPWKTPSTPPSRESAKKYGRRHNKNGCERLPTPGAACGDLASWSPDLRSSALLARGVDFICSFGEREPENLAVDVMRLEATPSRSQKRTSSKSKDPTSNGMPALRNSRSLSGLTSSEGFEMQAWNLQKGLNMPPESMAKAYKLFVQYAGGGGHPAGIIRDGHLSKAQFSKLLCELIGCETAEKLPAGMVEEAFKHADKDGGGEIEFGEFAVWFSSHCFCENMNLDEGQRELRSLARKHDMEYFQVEQYKRYFDQFDEDGSGEIEALEFDSLLTKCVKLPKNATIPASRVRALWRIADADSSGAIDFEEFLVFYKKYFDGAGFDSLYRVGRVSMSA